MPPIGILHVPHSSTEIPADLRSSFLLAEDQLRREVLRMTDWYTDELLALPAHEATTVRFPVSRLAIDPERFVDDAEEPMAGRGMGVIYTKTAGGLPLRALPSPQERQQLLDRFYHPHHQRLAGAVQRAMERHGGCLVIGCHSFPSVALPCDLDQAPRPARHLHRDRRVPHPGLGRVARGRAIHRRRADRGRESALLRGTRAGGVLRPGSPCLEPHDRDQSPAIHARRRRRKARSIRRNRPRSLTGCAGAARAVSIDWSKVRARRWRRAGARQCTDSFW